MRGGDGDWARWRIWCWIGRDEKPGLIGMGLKGMEERNPVKRTQVSAGRGRRVHLQANS